MVALLIPYVLVFLLNLFGGGIATFGVGVALRAAPLNLPGVFVAIIFADTLSDIFYYGAGRFASRPLQDRFFKRHTKARARFAMVETYFSRHGTSTVFLAKMSDVLAIPAVVLAGITKMRFGLYFIICLLTTIFKTALILGAGYLIGKSTDTTDAHFVAYGISGLFLLVFIVVLATTFYRTIRRQR